MTVTGARRVPDQTRLRRYLEQGLTQAQIVAAWGEESNVRVSRSAIAMAIKRYGLESAHSRPRYEDTLPWKVRVEHRMKYDARMLRLEARRRRGKALSDEDLRKLTAWRQQLEDANAVVAYEPELPEGFVWVVRREDDDDIIRRGRV